MAAATARVTFLFFTTAFLLEADAECSARDEDALLQLTPSNSSTAATEQHCAVLRQTYLESDLCGNVGHPPALGFLVTGTGRSGTKFLRDVLTRLGLEVSHDDNTARGRDGAVSWVHGYHKRNCVKPFWTWTTGSYFREAFLMLRDVRDRTLEVALKLYVLQNSFVEEYAVRSFRLEALKDDPQVIIDICSRYHGVNCTAARVREVMKDFGTRDNSRHTKKAEHINWSRLASIDRNFTAMAQALAHRHGYVIPREDRLPEAAFGYWCGFDGPDENTSHWMCMLKSRGDGTTLQQQMLVDDSSGR